MSTREATEARTTFAIGDNSRMTQQPFNASALRGAVDLSALARPATPGPGAPAGAAPGQAGALTQASDATFEAVVSRSTTVPTVLVLWTPQQPESVRHAEDLAKMSQDYEGRFVVVGVDLSANQGIVQALAPMLQQAFEKVDALPIVVGLLKGQPMPFYLGVQDPARLRPLFDQFLQAALTEGVTGRGDVGAPETDTAQDVESDIPPLHQAAYDAIETGDLDAATSAYEQALEQNPADEDARLGLGQVELLRRTKDLDITATRQAAADDPTDVVAQIAAADLDLVGGHVEDAFARLIDTVRVTSGEERNQAREHLIRLFDVIGGADPRVATARRALTNALF